MRNNTDLTPLEHKVLNVHSIINNNLPLEYKPHFKGSFNKKSF